MLTVDLVRAKKRKGELELSGISPALLPKATSACELMLASSREHEGSTRGDLRKSLEQAAKVAGDRKLGLGLAKLVEDACEFTENSPAASQKLREELFRLAAERRRAGTFERSAVIEEVARNLEWSCERVEEALYADLKGAERLLRAPTYSKEALLAKYELSQMQAVLLRAVQLRVWVSCKSPAQYRALFRKLKFRRLLFEVEPSGSGYELVVDGPYSLFESVTQYGLALSLCLPLLLECDEMRLTASVLWGRAQERVTFRVEHPGRGGPPAPEVRREDPLNPDLKTSHGSEIEGLVRGFEALNSSWRVEVAAEVVHCPGGLTFVPDLAFVHKDSGERVWFEQMGYWSREAVFKRLDQAATGLDNKLLLAVSEKLRVSEAVVEPEANVAIYVYKTVPSPKAILQKLGELVSS